MQSEQTVPLNPVQVVGEERKGRWLSLPLIDLLRAKDSLVVDENEPYVDEDGQSDWAERLARLMPIALLKVEAERKSDG